MIRAATTLIVVLLNAAVGPEAIDVPGRGPVDLATFECRDTPRSTLIQRACYDKADAILIVSVKGGYRQYCHLPAAAFDALMTAPSMGQFFKHNIETAGSDGTYDCPARREPRLL
jgi:KTSC domain